MFGIIGTDAAMAQAACAKKQVNILSFVSGDEDLSIWQVSCDGEIAVKTIKGGEAKEVTYTDLSGVTVALENDANTKVEIVGNVTDIGFYDEDNDDEEPVNISLLSTKKCKTLTGLQCSYCTGLSSLDLAANTALTTLNCISCTGLSSLDLAANTALTTLSCAGCTGLSSISYPATNSTVSTQIASAITNATAADGTVYTDSEGAYYSMIADAATAKGWTIEQL